VKLILKNCNNIDFGTIEINENSLNIKYAINGTGKSTIAKAIQYALNDQTNQTQELKNLTPFKNIGTNVNTPEITGNESINSIKIFNENYIDEFIFKEDELLKGSFDIFIRDDTYEKGLEEITLLTSQLQNNLAADQDIADLIKDFSEISSSFGKPTRSGGIHGSSGLAKALKDGNKVINIPKGLEIYKDFIQHDDNYKWVKWQLEGRNYLDISSGCPFCVTDIPDKKETIKKVGEVYESKSIENLSKVIATFERLKKYFSPDTQKNIDEFVVNIDGYTEDQVGYLMRVKDEIDNLSDKFTSAQRLGFATLKDVEKVLDALANHKINISYFPALDSEATNSKILIINAALDELIKVASTLQGHINKQRLHIESLIIKNKVGINQFLKNAGYKYTVDILEEDGRYKLKLLHNDSKGGLVQAQAHLSFGERNAFALVLFMFDSLKSKPSLIVLDDPISSFDKNKKYALIDMLFKNGQSLRGKTVLLLTHDFEPIVDMVFHHSDKFPSPHAHFLENWNGDLSEKIISKSDIKSFIEINTENIALCKNPISKIVYLRRLFEINQSNECYGFSILSSLLHKRETPTIKDESIREMTDEELKLGINQIHQIIEDFDYQDLYKLVTDDQKMKDLYKSTKISYEKLHIFRIIFDGKEDPLDSDVIRKFINESFHIENNYIYHLSPTKYALVPQYVLDECDRLLETI
jgi:energy-coupling factor transporter ATP-binding protein EcfA2